MWDPTTHPPTATQHVALFPAQYFFTHTFTHGPGNAEAIWVALAAEIGDLKLCWRTSSAFLVRLRSVPSIGRLLSERRFADPEKFFVVFFVFVSHAAVVLVGGFMAAEMVKSATLEKLKEMDWTKNIEICELVAKDSGQARAVIKSIKKRLGNKNANTQLFAVRVRTPLTGCNSFGLNLQRQLRQIRRFSSPATCPTQATAGHDHLPQPPATHPAQLRNRTLSSLSSAIIKGDGNAKKRRGDFSFEKNFVIDRSISTQVASICRQHGSRWLHSAFSPLIRAEQVAAASFRGRFGDPDRWSRILSSARQQAAAFGVLPLIGAEQLLEMLMNNCGEHIHRQVIDNGLLPILVKMVKKKTDFQVRERIFLLLDATQTALGGAKGKFPQYYAAYYDLVEACGGWYAMKYGQFKKSCRVGYMDMDRHARTRGDIVLDTSRGMSNTASQVQFPQRQSIPSTQTSQSKEALEAVKEIPVEDPQPNICHVAVKQPSSEGLPDQSIIHKATSVMEVLREVLNALAPRRPEIKMRSDSLNVKSEGVNKTPLDMGAADEFILDLVEQCSFQKQRIMHFILSCHNEKLMAQAIELNEQLDKVLAHHDSLLNVEVTSIKSSFGNEEAVEEENEESFFRRHRNSNHRPRDLIEPTKHRPRGYSYNIATMIQTCIPLSTMFRQILSEHPDSVGPHQPLQVRYFLSELWSSLIRKGKARADDNSENLASSFISISDNDLRRPLIRPLSIQPMDHNTRSHPPHPLAGSIPPPPARYMERERFFKEKHSDSPSLTGHMRGLSLHSCNGSSSRSGSTDFSDASGFHD
ncbi:hypothetical protein AXF42_Ash012781 [Apostasia shenzhenica]|uniref:VHS domain-containing protein n=1 Tax=Apostasia shenzhenica TaxID=1088818 RepID=A0A2I0AM58_9ASPA|nr:hypothetical protein AXF42_Ash012781 [Apostasia shenzhenica]